MNEPKGDLSSGRTAKKEDEEVRKVSVWIILLFGIYFVALSVLLLYAVISIWPTTSATMEGPVVLFGYQIGGGEVRLILIAALSGCLGSLIHAMTSLATYVGNRKFVPSWTCWYILRPFIGMPLALIFYFVIRGGFFTLSDSTTAVSPFGIAGLGGLVGMFSKQAIDKLEEIFENIFKTTKPDKRTDKLQDCQDDKDHSE